MLRWGLQHGRSVIAKSTKPIRIAENISLFDSELSADEMAAIDRLDTGRHGGSEPGAITLEACGREIPGAQQTDGYRGETLVVWWLDRHGRGLKHLIDAIGRLENRSAPTEGSAVGADTSEILLFAALARATTNPRPDPL